MFRDFADVWTPIELARRLGRRPRQVWLVGERVVLFRGEGGRVGALLDRCPHRGATLSLGRVVDGCVECPFHGWRFSVDGACRAVPLNETTPARRERLAATSLPVRELGGLVWVYTRVGVEPLGAPTVPAPLMDAHWVRWQNSTTWQVHWSRAMENSLDFAHLPFVHRNTIGLRFRKDVRTGATMSLDVEPTPTGMRVRSHMSSGHRVPVTLEYVRPNGMRLHLELPREERWLHLWCVPESESRTRVLLTALSNRGRYSPLRPVRNLFNQYIGKEDRRVAESILPSEVPPPHDEVHVPTDRPTLLFRRYYFEELRRPWSREQQDEARHLGHPDAHA